MLNQGWGEGHACPDCGSNGAQGYDRFGQAMPCFACVLKRMEKAFHADLDDHLRMRGFRRARRRALAPGSVMESPVAGRALVC